MEGWDARRALCIEPKTASKMASNQADREEFLEGCFMLGLIGAGKTLKPQQYVVADCLAAHHPYFALLMPRRSTKTTDLFAVALGRCARRDGYLVAYAQCTTGVKARDRFRKDIVAPLEKVYRGVPLDARPFKINRTGGSERIEFDNGSVFQVFPPDGASFRSDAFDLIILDESGEASPAMGEDVLAGALSTFDTRDDAQLVVAGTAAKYRKGNLLWDYLEDGRAGINRTGILEFAAPDTITDEQLADWEYVKKLILACHPGVKTRKIPDNLTSIETIRERWVKLRHTFVAEYLSVFGTEGASAGIVNMTQWAKGGEGRTDELGSLEEMLPKKFVAAFHVHPDQLSSTIVAVWREGGKDGRVKILVLEHNPGVNWLTKRVKTFSSKYRMIPLAHDTNGPVTVEAETIARMRPKVKLAPQTFPNVKTSAALIVKEIENGNVDHWNQETLTEACRIAKKRSVGPTAWALGRVKPEDDIIDLEAAALALRVYDAAPAGAIMPSAAAA